MRFNALLKEFADRLLAKGKPAKVVIVACMRKLMTLLNAMVRENLTWDELEVVKQLAARLAAAASGTGTPAVHATGVNTTGVNATGANP
jgi:transposase